MLSFIQMNHLSSDCIHVPLSVIVWSRDTGIPNRTCCLMTASLAKPRMPFFLSLLTVSPVAMPSGSSCATRWPRDYVTESRKNPTSILSPLMLRPTFTRRIPHVYDPLYTYAPNAFSLYTYNNRMLTPPTLNVLSFI